MYRGGGGFTGQIFTGELFGVDLAGALRQGTLSSVRQFLTIESPLKVMKNAFYFTSKSLFVLKILTFFHSNDFSLDFLVM